MARDAWHFWLLAACCLGGLLPDADVHGGLVSAQDQLSAATQAVEEAEAEARDDGDVAEDDGEAVADDSAFGEEADDEASAEDHPRLCPDIDDHHGSWEGTKKVGEPYTLYCAPGYEVIGTRGNGTHGSRSTSIVCPETLVWSEDLWCQDNDDCSGLKHGCGAMGVCMDLPGGYDCNCERGYPRNNMDGEIVCGSKDQQKNACGGQTCGSYGICIDLRGNVSEFETFPTDVEPSSATGPGKLTYRCECANGYVDDGRTCVPHDCGALSDQLGVWEGDTHTGGEYTLKCFPGASIWGGALLQITITCGNAGKWLSHPVCINPAEMKLNRELESAKYWANVGMVFVCVFCAAMAAGLTLGLVSLDPFGLEVLLSTRPMDYPAGEERRRVKRDQRAARRMLPLVKDHHMLLVTLLLFNTVANEALPLFLDELVSPLMAVFLSVSVVLVCGEILPAAIFTGTYQFAIASAFVPFVGSLQCLFYPIARPIARLLDHILPEEGDEDLKYNRAELRALLQLHGQPSRHRAHSSESEADDHAHSGSHTHSASSGSTALPGVSASSFASRTQMGRELLQVGAQAPGMQSAPHQRSQPGSDAGKRRGLHFAEEDDVVDIEQMVSMRPSLSQQADEDEAPRTVLSQHEVHFLNGAFALRDQKIEDKEEIFLDLRHCLVAHRRSRIVDLISEVKPGQRAVVVTNEKSDCKALVVNNEKSECKALCVRDVCGCLLLRDLFKGGRKTLEHPGFCRRVLVSYHGSVLQALQALADAAAPAGLVIECAADPPPHFEKEGDFAGCKVLGVVTAADLLKSVTEEDENEENFMSASSSIGVSLGAVFVDEDDPEHSKSKHHRLYGGSKFLKTKLGNKETLAKSVSASDFSVVSSATLRKRTQSASTMASGQEWDSSSSSNFRVPLHSLHTSGMRSSPELHRGDYLRASASSDADESEP